jgi:hypothetical protein
MCPFQRPQPPKHQEGMMKEKELSKIEEKPCEEYLPCVLTQEEFLDRSKKLAKANEDAEDLLKKKKDVTADFAAQQKKIESLIGVLSRKVSTGKEYRDVKCVWEFNYKSGVKRLRRLDTSEIVKEGTITQQERQQAATI